MAAAEPGRQPLDWNLVADIPLVIVFCSLLRAGSMPSSLTTKVCRFRG